MGEGSHCAEGTIERNLVCNDQKEVRRKSLRQTEERGRDGKVGMCLAKRKAGAGTGVCGGSMGGMGERALAGLHCDTKRGLNRLVLRWLTCRSRLHPGMSERERQVMKRLKEVVDKQRDEIRAKDRELGLKNEDVEAVSDPR